MTKKPAIPRRVFLHSTVAGSLALANCSLEGGRETAQETDLVDEPQVKRDFDKDGRSKKVILAAHCVLNQNARHVDCADFPATMKPLLAALQELELGILQMPCPELMALGLGRDRDVPPLETIREALELPEGQERLAPLIDDLIYQIKEYQFQGLEIVGILGKNGSPACGVETTNRAGRQGSGEGVFVELLKRRLEEEGLDIPIKGIDDYRQEETISWVKDRV